MAYVGEMELDNVVIKSRDFEGERHYQNFGTYQRSFSIEISDPELQEQLEGLGLRLSTKKTKNSYDEPDIKYLTVKVDYRFNNGGENDVQVIMISPEGNGIVLDEEDLGELQSAWIKTAELHVKFKSYEKGYNKGVSAYCQCLVVHLMGEEEKQEIMEKSRNKPSPLYEKYKNMVR